MGTVAQSSSNMQGLLVLASLAVASAPPPGIPRARPGLCRHSPSLRSQHSEARGEVIEVPVETIKFEVAETGCKNSFGHAVPCARRKRQAEDAVEVGAEAAAPAEAVAAPAVAAVLPFGYGYGLGYHGIGC